MNYLWLNIYLIVIDVDVNIKVISLRLIIVPLMLNKCLYLY